MRTEIEKKINVKRSIQMRNMKTAIVGVKKIIYIWGTIVGVRYRVFTSFHFIL